MTWVRLDDKRALNRKLAAAGLEARGLDEAGICFAAMQETDGYLAEADVAALAAAHGCTNWRRVVERLVGVGRWAPAVEGGWQIHDFLEFNPTRDQIAQRRKQDRVRKESARIPRRRQPESEQNPNGSPARGPGHALPHPDPTPPAVAGGGAGAASPTGRPSPPRPTRTEPLTDTAVTLAELRAADEARAEACGLCEHGWLTDDNGNAQRCSCQLADA